MRVTESPDHAGMQSVITHQSLRRWCVLLSRLISPECHRTGARMQYVSATRDVSPPLPFPIAPSSTLSFAHAVVAHRRFSWWQHSASFGSVHKALTAVSDNNYTAATRHKFCCEICRLRPFRRPYLIVAASPVHAWVPGFKPHRAQPPGIIRTRREWNSMENGDSGRRLRLRRALRLLVPLTFNAEIALISAHQLFPHLPSKFIQRFSHRYPCFFF